MDDITKIKYELMRMFREELDNHFNEDDLSWRYSTMCFEFKVRDGKVTQVVPTIKISRKVS